MDRALLLLTFSLLIGWLPATAQDDMYFIPKVISKEEKAKLKAEAEAKRRAEMAAEQRAYEEMMARIYMRIYHDDVAMYNRHYGYQPGDSLVFDSLGRGDDRIAFDGVSDSLYNVREDYRITRALRRLGELDFALRHFEVDYYP